VTEGLEWLLYIKTPPVDGVAAGAPFACARALCRRAGTVARPIEAPTTYCSRRILSAAHRRPPPLRGAVSIART
jgi:hypothetical protein